MAVIVLFVMDCGPAGARGLRNTSSGWIKLENIFVGSVSRMISK